ncbi:MAG: SUMF1/EgtB/PvdO family nonheme iron enzyme [Flavobacteriales bacterium]|nr:SUMF1/EgtB/PvdO family nonheme iron enzyme [Flavobacteriales bacterium]
MRSNNLQVGPATLVDADPNDGSAQVQFDIGWENSWRVSTAPNNWDAAWVFLKFRAGMSDPVLSNVNSAGNVITVASTSGLRPGMPVHVVGGTGAFPMFTQVLAVTSTTTFTTTSFPTMALSNATVRAVRVWEHAQLGPNGTHLAPPGATISVGCAEVGPPYSSTNPGVGVFIHRSADGTGTFTASGCALTWMLGGQGIVIGTPLELCVHALEMVLVPTGSYYVGGAGTNAFRNGSGGSTPRHITSEAYIVYATAFNVTLSYGGAGLQTDFGGGFPKGYEAFYSMKYEVAQGEYAAFLNKLTREQQAAMVTTNIGLGTFAVVNRYVMTNTAAMMNRSAIRCPAIMDPLLPVTFVCDADGDGIGNEMDDGEWTAANYLNAPSALAYLDWCALRPMSEMEFEKACRGPTFPIAGDYAWGGNTASIVFPTAQAGAFTATESVDDPANTSYGSLAPIAGPFRNGMFAEPSASRASAGASYYGILDLSGNVAEYTFSASYLSLWSLRILHGDGLLAPNGAMNVLSWPPDGFYGIGLRGGSWSSIAQYQRVSDRTMAAVVNTLRYADSGTRGVRRAIP